VAAFIYIQHRPFDPREGRLKKLAEKIYRSIWGGDETKSSGK